MGHNKSVTCTSDRHLCGQANGSSVSLSYLTDVFSHLNELNRKLQGPDCNILEHRDKVNTNHRKAGAVAKTIRKAIECDQLSIVISVRYN